MNAPFVTGAAPHGRDVGRLPRPSTSLIGRDEAVRTVARLLDRHRLVSLTGTGGVGKTRVAVEVARRAADDGTRVLWLDGAPVSSVASLRDGLGSALEAADTPERSLGSLVLDAAGHASTLLVIDNCEQLLDEVAVVVEELVEADNVGVLLTTREPLGSPGEQIWRVPSLSLVAPCRAASTISQGPSAAVALFLERAHDAQPDLTVDATTLRTIDAICTRLDGIPLAIELAAARCRHMSPEMILGALHDRFRLLTGGARTGLARHRTMRTSVDWSYELLTDPEQRALRTLSVFRSGFTLEAACAVVAEVHGFDSADLADVVAALVDKSMINFEGERYRLLDTIRAFGTELSGDRELAAARDAHANWFATWLTALSEAGMRPVDDAIASCEPDVIAALTWSQASPMRAVAIAQAAAGFWYREARRGDIVSLGLGTLQRVRDVDEEAWATLACRLAHAAILARCESFLDDDLPVAITIVDALGRYVDASLGYLALAHRHQSWAHGAAALAAARAAAHDGLIRVAAMQLCIIGLATADPVSTASAWETLEMWQPPSASSMARPVALARAYADYTAGRIGASASGFAELIDATAHEPTFRRVTTIGGFIIGLLAADAALVQHSRTALSDDIASGHADPATATVLEWTVDRSTPMPSFELLSRPFASLWRPFGALALVEAARPDLAVAMLASPPDDEAPGSFLAVAAAAVRAAIAQINDDHDVDRAWRAVLTDAMKHGYTMLVVDAFEALAARCTNAPRSAGRLLAAAEALRDDTDYRHRFAFQQAWVDQAARVAHPLSTAERSQLEWKTVAEWVRRSWGERHRPSAGWSALTPTEQRVVELVCEGLTNPEIGARLLMSRSTVKTHLAHVFVKVGVRSRAQLAGMLAERGSH